MEPQFSPLPSSAPVVPPQIPDTQQAPAEPTQPAPSVAAVRTDLPTYRDFAASQRTAHLTGPLVIGVGISLYFFVSSRQLATFIFFLLFSAAAAYLYRRTMLRVDYAKQSLIQFAALNDFTYGIDSSVTTFRHSALGHVAWSRTNIPAVVTGTIPGGVPIALYDFEGTIGSGKYQRGYSLSVLELTLPGILPEMLLEDRRALPGELNLVNAFGLHTPITLEGNFPDVFKLYGNEQNEIEIRQVFTPDVMALVLEDAANCSIEFSENHIYLYGQALYQNANALNHLFALAQALVGKLAGVSQRLESDSYVAPRDRSLALGNPNDMLISKNRWLFPVLIAVVVGGFLLLFVGVTIWAYLSHGSAGPTTP